MYASDIEIRPHSGWANIELGSTIAEVRAALATNGHAYDLADDELTIDIYSPKITFYFDDSEPNQLVQIVFSDRDHRIDGQPVIGLSLAEALLPLCPHSYEDTLWSLVSIEEEYQHGQILRDAERIRQSSSKQNLDCATLWILSQVVGLVMLDGFVHEVAIRKAGQAPTVGCGQLDSRTMELALSAKSPAKMIESPYPESLRIPKTETRNSRPSIRRSWTLRSALTLLAIVSVAFPAMVVYRDLTAWKQAIPVVGKVVETRFDGPFLEEVTVEYVVDSDSSVLRIAIPSTYTTSQQIGDKVDLLYRPEQPHRAMTRIQIRDEGWSFSPYLLFGCLAACAFFLHLAFPDHIRLNSRKRTNS